MASDVEIDILEQIAVGLKEQPSRGDLSWRMKTMVPPASSSPHVCLSCSSLCVTLDDASRSGIPDGPSSSESFDLCWSILRWANLSNRDFGD